jgi:hypothetical protein
MSARDTETLDRLIRDARERQTIAGARAIGLLSALISNDGVPKANRAHAVEIVAEFDAACATARAVVSNRS